MAFRASDDDIEHLVWIARALSSPISNLEHLAIY